MLYADGGRGGRGEEAYLVVGFDVELDLLAGEGSYSIVLVSLDNPILPSLRVPFGARYNLLDLHLDSLLLLGARVLVAVILDGRTCDGRISLKVSLGSQP